MKIGVLQTGSVAEEIIDQHGPYVTMFERMLQRADPTFSAVLWDVNVKGEIPTSPGEADGWIITGCRWSEFASDIKSSPKHWAVRW